MRGLILTVFLSTTMMAAASEIPTVSADLGECSARFTVTDGSKPLYNAKVRTRIKYGAFGVRKLDLEVGTDSNGKAVVSKLPNSAKQAIAFEIEKDGVSRTVLFEPEKQCQAQFEIDLRKPSTPPANNPQP